MALQRPMIFERANLTGMIGSIRSFVSYFQEPESKRLESPTWTTFSISNEWQKAFEETQSQGRLDM